MREQRRGQRCCSRLCKEERSGRRERKKENGHNDRAAKQIHQQLDAWVADGRLHARRDELAGVGNGKAGSLVDLANVTAKGAWVSVSVCVNCARRVVSGRELPTWRVEGKRCRRGFFSATEERYWRVGGAGLIEAAAGTRGAAARERVRSGGRMDLGRYDGTVCTRGCCGDAGK